MPQRLFSVWRTFQCVCVCVCVHSEAIKYFIWKLSSFPCKHSPWDEQRKANRLPRNIRLATHTHTHTRARASLCLYFCVCVCVCSCACVCVRACVRSVFHLFLYHCIKSRFNVGSTISRHISLTVPAVVFPW